MAAIKGTLFTRSEAATVLGISPEQVDLRIAQGFIEHVGYTLAGLALYREVLVER